MKLLITLIMLFSATTSSAEPFPKGDANIGQKLFERHNCNSCHAQLMSGDGNAIFTRSDRKVHDAAELLAQLGPCGSSAGIKLTQQEKQHLGAYLNRYYNLK